MSGFRMVSALTFLIATVLLIEQCLGQEPQRRRNNRNNRHSARGSAGLPSNLRQAYHQAVGEQGPDEQTEESENSQNGMDWAELFAPSTPAANQIECSFEIHTLRQVSGRCTRLGGSQQPYICQSGLHFAFDQNCSRIIENRQNNN